MNTWRYWQQAEEIESLAVALRTVLLSSTRTNQAKYAWLCQYAELVKLLGLDLLTVAVENECPARFRFYARDAGLSEFAAFCGLRVRELHPPEAAAGLDGSAEFADHFRDSYLPLMREAISNGQAVLAWRGWPEPAQYAWGIVTNIDEHGRAYGYAPARPTAAAGGPEDCSGGSNPVQMAGPALQVYIVEDWQPPELPSFEQYLRHRLRLAVAAFQGQLPTPANTRLGRAAYQVWRNSTLAGQTCPRCGTDSSRCRQEMMQALLCSRTRLWADLSAASLQLAKADRHGATPAGTDHDEDNPVLKLLKEWAQCVRQWRNRLEPYMEESILRRCLASPAGRQELAAAFEAAQQTEERFAELAALNLGRGGQLAQPWLSRT